MPARYVAEPVISGAGVGDGDSPGDGDEDAVGDVKVAELGGDGLQLPAAQQAAAQIGETLPGKPAYGRSLIADPWGVVVAQAPDEETVITAELDRAHLQNIRAKLPSLANRQPNAYRWPTRV